MPMKTRFRLIHRGERGNQFYCVDSETGRRVSLKTKDRDAALQIVLAKNRIAPATHAEPADRQSVSGRHRQRRRHPHLAERH